MKFEIEIHETATRPPKSKDAPGEMVMAYCRDSRVWDTNLYDFVGDPVRYPLWFSLRDLPKPPPLKARKAK